MIRRLLKKIYRRLSSKKTQPVVKHEYQPPPVEQEAMDDSAEEIQLEVEAKEVVQWQEEGQKPLFIDIRQPYELRSGFIPNAYLIPMNQLATQVDLFPKDVPLVLYCAAGARSFGMAHFMREKGFENSWSLIGGVAEWHEHEFPASAAFQLLQDVLYEEENWTIWGITEMNEERVYRLRKSDTLQCVEGIAESCIQIHST